MDCCICRTPAFSSPESFTDPSQVSFATDIWSVGVTLFHLISRSLPFDCSSPIAASINVAGDMESKAPDVRDSAPAAIRANISSSFSKVIAKCLEKCQEKRFASVDALATALYGCLVEKGEAMYSAFISYRVSSEKYHAQLLYELLNNTVTCSGHRVIVYLDTKRLVKGEDWEHGFSLGLLNSIVALPMLSKGVLTPMTRLSGSVEDMQDNVLKELIIMKVLKDSKLGRLTTIYPILCGPACSKDHPEYPKSHNFFHACSGLCDQLKKTHSPPTTKSVYNFLRRMKISCEENLEDLSVYAVISSLLSIQGHDLRSKADTEVEPFLEDDELVKNLYANPPSPPIDTTQLHRLKAELKALVPLIHDVLDSALADMSPLLFSPKYNTKGDSGHECSSEPKDSVNELNFGPEDTQTDFIDPADMEIQWEPDQYSIYSYVHEDPYPFSMINASPGYSSNIYNPEVDFDFQSHIHTRRMVFRTTGSVLPLKVKSDIVAAVSSLGSSQFSPVSYLDNSLVECKELGSQESATPQSVVCVSSQADLAMMDIGLRKDQNDSGVPERFEC